MTYIVLKLAHSSITVHAAMDVEKFSDCRAVQEHFPPARGHAAVADEGICS